MNGQAIIAESEPFFEWLASWYDNLQPAALDEVLPDPSRGAILAADLVVGFCKQGALASERVNAIVAPAISLLERAHRAGLRRVVLAQDTHTPGAPEFQTWPEHCVRDTEESRMVPELENLPFAREFTVIEKNTLSAGVGTEFESWLRENDDLTDYVVTGDCTDLCTYNLAMYVLMWNHAQNREGRRVWVDAGAVQTYDLPVSAAGGGALPHPGDFIHMFFLYHMALNGIRVVSRID